MKDFDILVIGLSAIVALIAVAIPTFVTRSRKVFIAGFLLIFASLAWDVIPSDIYFQRLCAKDIGETVFRVVPVDGFMATGGTTNMMEDLLRRGYRYLEKRRIDGKLTRYSYDDGEALRIQAVDEPRSRFVYGLTENPLNLGVSKITIYIKSVATDETLGSVVEYRHRGGWLRRMIFGKAAGSSSICRDSIVNVSRFIYKTIPPNHP